MPSLGPQGRPTLGHPPVARRRAQPSTGPPPAPAVTPTAPPRYPPRCQTGFPPPHSHGPPPDVPTLSRPHFPLAPSARWQGGAGRPPPSEIGSSASLASSTTTGRGGATRVTSDTTPAIGTGIAANTDTVAAALSAAAPRGTSPEREGFAAAALLPPSLAATRCRVGLQVSCTGVGAMLNTGIPRPLTEIIGESHSKKTRPP